MTHILIRSVGIALLLHFVCNVPTLALAEPAELKGIKEFRVLVETVNRDGTSCGVSEETIQNMCELKVMQSHFTLSKELGSPLLYINAFTIKDTQGTLIYNVRVDVETGTLKLTDVAPYYNKEAKNVTIPAFKLHTMSQRRSVWDKSILGYAGAVHQPNAVYETIGEIVDQCMHDALLANQPKQ